MGTTQGVVRAVYEANGGWHDVRLENDDRKYSTKKKDLWGAAELLEGQFVEIEYSTKQNGEYTNYYLDKIEGASLDQELRQQSSNGSGSKTKMAMDPQERAEIRRMNALNNAVALAPDLFTKTDDPATNQLKISNVITTAAFLEHFIEQGADAVLS